MEGLLKWSIDAQQGKATGKPDPKQLSQLMGAPDDVTMMREELNAAVESKDNEERLACLNAFEEHVENVDNADNIGKLWEPLLYLAKDEDPEIRAAALGCIAAAVQNNTKSQNDLVATKSGIPTILESVNASDEGVASKALFALSSSIAHCQPAYEQFSAAKGWIVLDKLLEKAFKAKSDAKYKSRVVGLVYAIVLLLPQNEICNELDRINVKGILEKAKAAETSSENNVVKNKIDNVLTTMADYPPQPVKLLN